LVTVVGAAEVVSLVLGVVAVVEQVELQQE
jgi:hypothetical protein